MSAVYNSNTVPYGSMTIPLQRGAYTSTSNPAPVTVIADSVTVNRPCARIDRPNQIGEPNGFVLVAGQVTGSCVLQYTALVQPEVGDYFTLTLDTSIGVEWFVIESVDTPYAALDYHKANCTFVKDYSHA